MESKFCACGNPRRPKQRTCRQCHAAYMRSNRRKHSELSDEQRKRANCRAYSRFLVVTGKIPRLDACEKCGAPDPERHHPDYDNPRLIEWLCRACHKKLHMKHYVK